MTAVKKFFNSDIYDRNITNLIHEFSGKDEMFYKYLEFGMVNSAFEEAVKKRSERLILYLQEKYDLNSLNWNYIAGIIIKYDFTSSDSTVNKILENIFSNVTNWTCIIAQEAKKGELKTVYNHSSDENLDQKIIIKYATESGDKEIIQKYTELLGNFPKSILEGAARLGDMKLVQYALEQDELEDTEESALIALENGHLEIYELLKEDGKHEGTSFSAGRSCDKKIIHAYATDICSAIAGICYSGDVELAIEYIENYKNCVYSALIGAVQGKQPLIIEYVLTITNYSATALNIGLTAAVRSNCLSLTKYFVEKGANNIKSALTYAEQDGYERIVEYLENF